MYNVAAGSANWGNGYFATTAITDEGTNASGIGKFEYDVPTGYTALSLKGLQRIMAFSTIDKSTDSFMNPVLYTGNASTQIYNKGLDFNLI